MQGELQDQHGHGGMRAHKRRPATAKTRRGTRVRLRVRWPATSARRGAADKRGGRVEQARERKSKAPRKARARLRVRWQRERSRAGV